MEKEELLQYVAQYLFEHPMQKKEEYAVTDWAVTDSDFVALISAALDRWLTEGKLAKEFRYKLAEKMQTRYAVLTNSGSSANLLALTAAKDFFGAKNGMKVITCATAFPTTVAPIIQNGLVPLFIDINPETLTYDEELVVDLLSRDDVAGVFLAHNLGFPFDANMIYTHCMEQEKFLIADCCDALGTTINGESVGAIADFSTLSFFPAHHITTGEGGSVQTDDARLFRLLQQYGNWGRDCWCEPGKDNTCNKRFSHNFGTGLPIGYDHKYTFTKVGYNMKVTELQAAFGLSQISRVDEFIEKRRANYTKLYKIVKPYDLYLRTIPLPEGCSPFGFPMIASSSWTRQGFVEFLEASGVRTRPIFSGNILKHPMMQNTKYEVAGTLDASDSIMHKAFWIGVHPSVTEENLELFQRLLKEYF